MRYMHEIFLLSQKNPNTNWKEVRAKYIVNDSYRNIELIILSKYVNIIICIFKGLGSRRYLKKELNEVRELWAEFFIVECL